VSDEERQSGVGCGASVRGGGVGEGGSEQFGSAESVADRVLAVVEDGPFSGGGGQFRRRHDSDYTGRNKNVSVWEAYYRAGSASTLRPWRRLVDPGTPRFPFRFGHRRPGEAGQGREATTSGVVREPAAMAGGQSARAASASACSGNGLARNRSTPEA